MKYLEKIFGIGSCVALMLWLITQAKAVEPLATSSGTLLTLQEQAASKAAELKKELNEKLQNKAYMGELTQIDNLTESDIQLILQTNQGEQKLLINQFTILKDSQGKSIPLKNLQSGIFLIALGDLDADKRLIAKSLVITSPPKKEKQIWKGQVKNILNAGVILTLSDSSEKTVYFLPQIKVVQEDQEVTITKIKPGMRVAVVVEVNKGGNPNVGQGRFIYLEGPLD